MTPLHIDSLEQLFSLAGLPAPAHPRFAILPVETINHLAGSYPLDFSLGFYTIGMMHDLKGEVRCGRRSYDFGTGTMFFTSPNQLIGHSLEALTQAKGWLLLFHRSYLARHPLSKKVQTYGFFDYAIDEALHLSAREEASLQHIFDNIHTEYQQPIDRHSRPVVLANLELLLTYSDRYYQRQFITRNEEEEDFLVDFERLLEQYFQHMDLEKHGPPNGTYFAEQMHLSPKYLSDKLKVLTGKTMQEHIHFKLVENAKVYLQEAQLSVSEIAYRLGFEYPQYFSRFFKKKVGISPTDYRVLN